MKTSQPTSLARVTSLALVGLLLCASSVLAQEGRASASYNLGPERLALQGYDPVAYFEVGGGFPAKGSPEITSEHEAVVYRFANEENRKLFEASPETYEPAFGGWCAYAMSKNKKVKVDPKAFRIGEGRLLLFVDDDYLEFDDDWVPEEHELLEKADKNWKAMSGESPRKAAPGSWRPVQEWNLSDDCLAIEGWDPVSYFPEGGGKPVEGSKAHQVRHGGVLYRFASEKNAKAFVANPEKYEPQHGGWCSYAMGAKNKKVEIQPNNYRLTNGQLHLFYSDWFSDTSDDWDEDTANLKRKADANWAKRNKQARAQD
jgi:YHS domain-containing protein